MRAPSSPFPCASAIKFSSSKISQFYCIAFTNRRRFLVFPSPEYFSSFPRCCNGTSKITSSTRPESTRFAVEKSTGPKTLSLIESESELNDENSLSQRSILVSQNRRFKDGLESRSLSPRIFSVSKKLQSIILLNVITIIYASNIPVVKEVEVFVDPELFSVVRFVFSSIPFIPFVLKARDDVQTRNAGIELGFWLSLGYLMQALGLVTSDAGRASFICMFTVVVVPLLDGMLGSVIPARTWFGAMMSVLGVAMLESSGSPPCVGDVLNILSAVFFGVHMLRTEHISRTTSKENFLSLLGYEVCVVALLSTVWYIIEGSLGGMQKFNPASWSWHTFWDGILAFPWIPAVYTGMVSTGLCLWIEIAAMRDVSATEAAIIYGLEPVWGAGFAWFLLGERWGINGWIGAGLVLGGSLAVQISGLSTSSSSSRQSDEEEKKGNNDSSISNKQSVFSNSAVVNSSKETRSSIVKK